MPVHDWTLVEAGIFHHFHTTWMTHLSDTLNGGALPEGYYAMAEQHAGAKIADVLTLQAGAPPRANGSPTVAVLEKPPKAMRKLVLTVEDSLRRARRTVAIRHVSNHRIVALIEIFSPANKDRPASVEAVRDKAYDVISQGIHLLVVDLFPPGPHDPHGLAGAAWENLGPVEDFPPADKPLGLGAFMAAKLPEAYVDAVAVGEPLPGMALFLEVDGCIRAPLEATYLQAYRGVPAYWRAVLEGRNPES